MSKLSQLLNFILSDKKIKSKNQSIQVNNTNESFKIQCLEAENAKLDYRATKLNYKIDCLTREHNNKIFALEEVIYLQLAIGKRKS
jgi:ABC-type phosphate transport system auxiliary subunit